MMDTTGVYILLWCIIAALVVRLAWLAKEKRNGWRMVRLLTGFIIFGAGIIWGVDFLAQNVNTGYAHADLAKKGYSGIQAIQAPAHGQSKKDVATPFSQREHSLTKNYTNGNDMFAVTAGGFGYVDFMIRPPADIQEPGRLPTKREACIVRFGLWFTDAQGWFPVAGSGQVLENENLRKVCPPFTSAQLDKEVHARPIRD